MNHSAVPEKFRTGWYWAGCVILALTAIGHTAAIVSGSPPPENADQASLLKLMETCTMKLPGATRTTKDLLVGFNWFFTLFFAGMALSSVVIRKSRGNDAKLIRTVAALNAFLLGLGLLVSLRFFFLIPTACIGAAILCFAIAYAQLGTVKPHKT